MPALLEATRLTNRQTEILILLCDGLSSKEVATRLGIATKTVEFHRNKMKEKLQLSSLPLLVRWAIRNKVIET